MDARPRSSPRSNFLGSSLSLGAVAGIPIRVHWSFSLLLVWVAFSHFTASGNVATTLVGLLFVLVVFGCVILHELGHSLTALHYGICTRSITLAPIGGVAAFESFPRHWRKELLVTLAGPAVNAVIAALLLPVVIAVAPFSPVLVEPFSTVGNLLFMLLMANVVLTAFNLVPAFPMDGGRILRALLASGGDRARATHVAARIGQAFAVLLGLGGLFLSPFLVLIAGFVFLAAEAERRSAVAEETFAANAAGGGMRRSTGTVDPSDTVEEAARRALRTGRHTLSVTREGISRGRVDLPSLLAARARGLGGRPVGDMVPEPMPARLATSGRASTTLCREGGAPSFPQSGAGDSWIRFRIDR